ncbi:MAG: hypothetical protein OSJ61_01250 [Lachnospiraceae bacterium]|nr:hypothetical protein [Lachnospiraceae bacterium]
MKINHEKVYKIRAVLNDIAERFCLSTESATVKQAALKISLYDVLSKKLRDLMERELLDETVAVWGNGKATMELFLVVKVLNNLVCIVDKNKGENLFFEFEKVPIILPAELNAYNPTTVVIPTKKYEVEIREELQKLGYKGKIIGIHSWLDEQGLPVEQGFFTYRSVEKYRMINEIYLQYKENPTKENFYCVLMGLLLIRDYPHVLSMIDEYGIKHTDSVLQKLKKELLELFSQIRKYLNKQENRHVMMYVVDALTNEEVQNMPFLKQIANDNFSFETYMTQYNNTRESVMTMLTGYKIAENKLYNRRYFDKKDGVLLPYLARENFKFNFIIDKIDYAFIKINDMSRLCTSENAPEVYFEGLCEMLESGKSTFNYMHCIAEVHPPFWNPLFEKKLNGGEREYSFEEYKAQYCSSQQYMDEIIWFYYKICEGTNITQIILGDHGSSHEERWLDLFCHSKNSLGNQKYDREMINPPLIIADRNVRKGRNTNIVCNYSLATIIRKVLEKSISVKDLTEWDDKYVRLACIPVYNKECISRYIDRGDPQMLYGFVGIWTKQEVYIEREDGERLFLIHGNKKNLISQREFQDKVFKYAEILNADRAALRDMLKLDRCAYHNEALKEIKTI